MRRDSQLKTGRRTSLELTPLEEARAAKESRENAIRDYIIAEFRRIIEEERECSQARPFYVLEAGETAGGSQCRLDLTTAGQRKYRITIEEID
jgi:hypothetical protein